MRIRLNSLFLIAVLLLDFSNQLFAACSKCKKVSVSFGMSISTLSSASMLVGGAGVPSFTLMLPSGPSQTTEDVEPFREFTVIGSAGAAIYPPDIQDLFDGYDYDGDPEDPDEASEEEGGGVFPPYAATGSADFSITLDPNSCYHLYVDDADVGSSYTFTVQQDGSETHNIRVAPPGGQDSGEIGQGKVSMSSIHWYSYLGMDGGTLRIDQNQLTEDLYSPATLISMVNPLGANNEVIKAGSQYRQLKTLQALADIVTISSSQYEVRIYPSAQVGAKIVQTGLYQVSGNPTQVWTFEKPSTSTTTVPQFQITSAKDKRIETYLFTQDIANNVWTLDTQNGQKVETHQTIEDSANGLRTEISIVSQIQSDNTRSVVSKVLEKYKTFPWGEGKIEEHEDPDGVNLTTLYYYYENSSDTTNYSKQKAILNPDGSWTKYVYYSPSAPYYGKVWKTYRPYKDLPSTYDQATETNCDVTEIQYGFSKSVFPDYIRYQVEKINGTTVSKKSWDLYDEPYNSPNGVAYNVVTKDEYNYYGTADSQSYQVQKIQTYSSNGYGNGAPLPNAPPSALAGRTACITYPDGRLDTYWYESGKWDASSHSFMPDSTGTAYRQMVTHGTKQNSFGIPYQTTRFVKILNNLAYRTRDEEQVYTGSDYQTITAIDYLNDATGNTVETRQNGRIIQSATYISGQKISEQDETGIETTYTYDSLGNPASAVRKGASATVYSSAIPDQTTATVYDVLGRQISATINAGAQSQTTASTYDVAGRIASETSQGLTTWHSYWNGGRNHQVSQPNGATQITETYIDGETKNITGTSGVSQYFDYGIDPVGNRWTRTSTGSVNSARYTKTTVDQLGREVITETPAFGGGTPIYRQSFYDDAGRLFRVRQSGQADQITSYDNKGDLFRSGLDIDGDGKLTLASMDRITEKQTRYEKTGTQWYRITTTKNYLKDNDATPLVTLQKEALGATIETQTYNEFSQLTRQETTIDRAAKMVIQTTDTPDSSIDAVSVSINGLLVSQSSTTISTPIKYRYDGFGRFPMGRRPDKAIMPMDFLSFKRMQQGIPRPSPTTLRPNLEQVSPNGSIIRMGRRLPINMILLDTPSKFPEAPRILLTTTSTPTDSRPRCILIGRWPMSEIKRKEIRPHGVTILPQVFSSPKRTLLPRLSPILIILQDN